MRIVLFYHSLISDWNHGNAHFLRGVMSELLLRGHDVVCYEPKDSWSATNLLAGHGQKAIRAFFSAYPALKRASVRYDPARLDLDEALVGADLAIVHEWNDRKLVRQVGRVRRRRKDMRLLFHDTHHRAVTEPKEMQAYDLSNYDGVLAFGKVLRDIYLARGWTGRCWTWHEAADTRIFRPIAGTRCQGDLVWVGNWGDGERSAELREFLLRPVQELGLRARVHGVRYPESGKAALRKAGIEYGGWLANHAAPQTFSGFKVTVHVPRRPYVRALPGIPTIRVFEALACGIPLICAPWKDAEGLFSPGKDYLVARSGEEMTRHLQRIIGDPDFAADLAANGHRTILSRHTCAHRVDELLEIVRELQAEPPRHGRNGSVRRVGAAHRALAVGGAHPTENGR